MFFQFLFRAFSLESRSQQASSRKWYTACLLNWRFSPTRGQLSHISRCGRGGLKLGVRLPGALFFMLHIRTSSSSFVFWRTIESFRGLAAVFPWPCPGIGLLSGVPAELIFVSRSARDTVSVQAVVHIRKLGRSHNMP